ncbi:unnamed protein product, partial [Iphiclides podalirius]
MELNPDPERSSRVCAACSMVAGGRPATLQHANKLRRRAIAGESRRISALADAPQWAPAPPGPHRHTCGRGTLPPAYVSSRIFIIDLMTAVNFPGQRLTP